MMEVSKEWAVLYSLLLFGQSTALGLTSVLLKMCSINKLPSHLDLHGNIWELARKWIESWGARSISVVLEAGVSWVALGEVGESPTSFDTVCHRFGSKVDKTWRLILVFLFDNQKMDKTISVGHRCQTQGPRAECGPPRHFMRPLTAWKTYAHLYIMCFYFEGFKLNGFVIILENCSCVQYFYSWINHNQMQRELSHSIFYSLYSASVTLAL